MANRVVEVLFRAKDKTKQGVKSVVGGLKSIKLGHAAIIAAAGVAAKKVVDFIKVQIQAVRDYVQGMAELGDAMDKMSLRTSVSVEELNQWDFVLQRAGGSSADLETSVRRMSASMNDYTREVAKSVEIWDDLGVSVVDADGDLRGISETLLDLADAFSKSDNETEKMAFSQEVLGRGGLKMLAAINQGSDGIREQWLLLKQLNGEVSREFATGAALIIDAETDIQFAINGLKADLIEPFQTDIAEVLETIALAVGTVGKAVDDNKGRLELLGDTAADVAQQLTRMLFPQEAMVSRKFGEWVRQTADDTEELGDKTEKTTETLKSQGERMAKMITLLERWNVETHKTVIDPVTLEVTMVPKTDAELIAELSAAMAATQAIIDAGVVDAPEIPIELAVDEEQFHDLLESLREIPEVAGQTQEAMDQMMDGIAQSQDQMLDVISATASGIRSELTLFLNGQKDALMLGRAIRQAIIPALVDMIVKLTVVRGLMSVFGLGGGGGGGTGVSGEFGGGNVSAGLFSGDGSPAVSGQFGGGPAQFGGMIQTKSAMTSPFDVTPKGGSVNLLSATLVMGRPVSRLDEIDLARRFTAAVKIASEDIL